VRLCEPHGPFRITSSRQVTVPKELTEVLGIRAGDRVYMSLSQDRQYIVLSTAEQVAALLRAGYEASADGRGEASG